MFTNWLRAGFRAFALISLFAGTLLYSVQSLAQEPVKVDVPAGPLATALKTLASQAGIEVLFPSDMVAGKQGSPVSGTMTAEQALEVLLKDSGLEAHQSELNRFVVRRAYARSDGGSEAVPEARLPEVNVTAHGDRNSLTEGTGSYATKAITIGKMPLSPREIPQSVSVISRQRIEDQNLVSLEDVLEQSTGFKVMTNGPGSGNIFARGFQVDTFQFDGVAQDVPGYSFSKPDLAPYDRVEVLRGSAGLLQGTGNPSAAINLVRKRPSAQLAASATAYAGSWDYYRGEVDVGGPLNESGSLRGRAVLAYEDRDYFIDIAESQKLVFYGIAEYDLVPGTLLTFGAQTQRTDAVPLIYGLPRYSDGSPLPLPRSTYLAPVWNDWALDLTQVFASIEHRWENDWKAKLSLEREWETSIAKRTITYGAAGFQPVDPATLDGGLSGRVWDETYERDGLDANVSGPFSLLGRSHTLLAGVSARRSHADGSDAGLPTFIIDDVLNFDPHGIPEPPNPPFSSQNINDVDQYGVYGSGRISLSNRLTLVLGGRLDWYDVLSTSRDLLSGVRTTSADYTISANFMPYLGAVLDLGASWSLYGSYADIFQPQTFQFTSSGEALDPIVGATYEVGVKGELLDGTLNTSLALFRIDQENRAQEDLAHPCAGAPVSSWCYVAQGEVRSEGVEAEISGSLLPQWQVFAGYTFNTTKYVRDQINQGKSFMTQTPRHILRVWTNYQLSGDWSDFSIGAGINAQSSYYSESGDVRAEQSAYAILNARLAYRVNDRFSAALNVNNLLDKTYFAAINGIGYGSVYGDPRNVMLTLRATY
jgi:outer membrane receptor for ferric coprogen and ferric-rhodotorulic acid